MSMTSNAGWRRAGRAAKPRLASVFALLWAGVSWTILSGVAAPCARAQEQTLWFDIPAQPLSSALLDFARQARAELLLPETSLEGVNSREARGAYRASGALSRLLEGTGFEGRLEGGVVRLSRAAPPRPARIRRHPGVPSPPPPLETVIHDDIVVVGTNIRGPYSPSSPVDLYTARDIARTGATSADQFIDTLTQNLDSRTQYGPGSTAAFNLEGVNGIDLRGLGVGASLVLVNGRRLSLASEGRTVDVSLIPLSAIDRVEVLTDGASAIYGSDAIGGVVNFVLKGDIDRAETRIDFGSVTEGDLRSGGIAHSIGGRWNGGAAFLSISGQSASALERMDRDYAAAAGRGDLSPDDVRYSLAGSFSLDATNRLFLSGDLLTGLRKVKSDFEIPELQTFITNRTETENLFLNFDAGYDINEALRASLIVTYSRRDDDVQRQVIQAGGVAFVNPDTEYSSFDATLKLDGRLLRLLRGDIRFSLGGGRAEERFWSRIRGYEFGRSMTYAFGEIFAPILGEAQKVTLVHRLELSLAARYTDYADESRPRLPNDFGDHISPKIGLLWAPTDWLNLRGSFSESFRAPALVDLDPTSAVNSLTVALLRGEPAVVLGVVGPRRNLDPETAKTYTAGFDLAFPFQPRLRVRATYFNVDYSGRISLPDPTFGLAPFANPDDFGDILFATDSAALIEEILASTTNTFNAPGIDLGDPAAAAAQLAALPNFVVFDDRLRNFDRVRLDGFDLDVTYGVDTRLGKLSFGSRVTYMTDYTERISANAPTLTVVDTILRPVDLRGRAYIGLARGGLDATIAVNYVDDYRNPFSASGESVESWTTWDMRVDFELTQVGEVLNDSSLSLSIQNIFDRDPPFAATSDVPGLGLSTSVGFDNANANPVGRFIAIELSKRW
jgi:outer membrane receptor protein involved in Fe transport